MRISLFALPLLLLTLPAQALDCSRAKAPLEKSICADPAANAADDAMTAAFTRFKAKLTPEQGAALLDQQRQWLKQRQYRCEEKKNQPLGTCLKQDADIRTAHLDGRPEAGTYAPGAFATTFTAKRAKRAGEYDVTLWLMKFADPRSKLETAFNAAVDAGVRGAPLNEGRDATAGRKLAYEASMRITSATPDLISAEMAVYLDGGGAHPNSSTSHINIDGRNGRKITLTDVFTPEGQKTALELCNRQIKMQKEEKGPGEEDAEWVTALPKLFADMANWSFAPEQTSLYFNPYELGSYAEGAYTCDFKNTELRPLLKSGFPLPQ